MIAPTHPKTQAIARSITIVARHFGVDPMLVGSKKTSHCPKVKIARECLWHHFHACGMSWRAIGRIWNRSVHSLTEGARMVTLKLEESDRLMMARLPQIPTTLEITDSKVAPVFGGQEMIQSSPVTH